MKTNRTRMMARCLIFTGLAACFSAAMLSAEDWQATFSLPVETRWAGIVLPAGDYRLYFNTARNEPMLLTQGGHNIGFVGVLEKETVRTPTKSQLLIVGGGKAAAVHILYIADLGTAFHFKVPERYQVSHQLITRAEPAVIQRIPVTVLGK